MKKISALLIAVIMVFSVVPNAWAMQTEGSLPGNDQETTSVKAKAEQSAILVFSNSGITEPLSGTGYSIDGTSLTITAAGTYRIKGSCSDGSIVVDKSLSDVTLILDSFSLASESTAPVLVKKKSKVSIHLEGQNTLIDNEDPADEGSSDAAAADAFEGAAIKIKSGSTVTFCGSGDLSITANAKNGIKGGSTSSLIFKQSGTINISGSGKYYGGTKDGAAVNSGISCDGSIEFYQGIYVIKSAGDGIKSTPDATDQTEGTTIDTESAGSITVYGGSFDIASDGDAFQADTSLTIKNGTFNIQTWKGHGVWNDVLASSYSCKGFKTAGDRAEEAGIEPAMDILGGTFILDTGDDAFHSEAYLTVTGGVFTIDTGDDAMHADTTLKLGSEGGLDRDPDVTVNSSYEGLEAGNVYIYSGRYYIAASDDGINAAGGSSNGTDPGHGGFPGPGPGHGGWNPSPSGEYNIYVYGGDIFINCDGDGLDSNGGLYLYGGRQAVFSMKSGGDNSALDSDGVMLVDGATIFTAGSAGVDGTAQSSWFGSNQKYYAVSTYRVSDVVIDTKAGSEGELVFSYDLPKPVSYMMASWPKSVSETAPVFNKTDAVTVCKGVSYCHIWDAGVITKNATAEETGLIKYTCSECGETETRTIPKTVTIGQCDHSVEIETEDEGFKVTFAGDAGVSSIIVYETQDYSGDSETVSAAGSTVSRSSDTGDPDSSGNGQVNFTVVLKSGYKIDSVTATAGTYKNIKGPSDTGKDNTYRITKISADTTVTITTINTGQETLTVLAYPESVLGDSYSIEDNTVTVDFDSPCRLGYISGDRYVPVTALQNEDGTHSFVVPEGINEVILVVKGDATGEGSVNLGDAARIKAFYRHKADLDAVSMFAADVNDDDSVNLGDAAQITAAFRKKYTIQW